jgi:hypothetical protein
MFILIQRRPLWGYLITFLTTWGLLVFLQYCLFTGWYVATAYVVGQTPQTAIMSFSADSPIPYEPFYLLVLVVFSAVLSPVSYSLYNDFLTWMHRSTIRNAFGVLFLPMTFILFLSLGLWLMNGHIFSSLLAWLSVTN